MNIKLLQSKRTYKAVLLIVLLCAAGMTKMNAQKLNRVSRNALMQPVQQQVLGRDIDASTMQVMNSSPRTTRGEGELDYTTYDWQSNAGAITRTIVWPDGKVNFAYTMATNSNFTDRGTGIGTYDFVNDAWIPGCGRVENFRTGFGSIARYGQNGIVVAAHTTIQCCVSIVQDKDNITPNSAPVVNYLDNTFELAWPNVMTSGPNRNIIHVIATSYLDGISIPGMENVNQPILYFRSQDGGLTWDKQNVILPYMDASYCLDWGSNVCYWMETTEDNCLALVVNNAWSDGFVLYSYDNGETWERKIFYKHPNPFGTFDNWFLYPRWTSCQWDSQHHLHVLYEFNGCSGEVGSGSFYPGIGGVAYWNETMPYRGYGVEFGFDPNNPNPPVHGQPFVMDSAYIAKDIYSSWWLWSDATHDMWPEYVGYLPTLDDYGNWENPYTANEFNIEDRGRHGSYNSGVCGFPVLCIVPGTNGMVAVWCAMDENHTDGNGNYYYKIFASYSGDGGINWTNMVHLTNDFMFEYSEFVYLQAAVVGNKLIIAAQCDGMTGTYVQSDDSDPYDNLYQGFTFDLEELFGVVPGNTVYISAMANPTAGGHVAGAGSFVLGSACTLTAVANSGYSFVNWTKNGVEVSTSATYSFTVTESASYVANFMENQSSSYTIIATANPAEGGSVVFGTEGETLLFEPFEEYTVGNKIALEAIAAGHDWWTTWSNNPGSNEDGVVANYNGTQCGHLTYGSDQVLLLGNEENGVYDLEFDILVPQGKNGYFNILHHFAGSNSTWAMQCYLHMIHDGQNTTQAPGHGTIHAGSNSTADIPCVYDAWMHFRLRVDTDNDVASYYYTAPGEGEILICEWQWSLDSYGENVVGRNLDAMDFYPPDNSATSEFYLDNFSFKKIGGESAPALSITPTYVQKTLGEDDIIDVPVTINNSGNSIGEWTGWLEFGQGGTGSQTVDLYYHNGEVSNGIGSSDAYTREMGIRLPATAYAGASMGMRIVSAQYYIYDDYQSADHNYIFRLYGQGPNNQPGELLAEKTVNSIAAGQWITATFDDPIYMTGQTIWATVQLEQAAGEYPLSMDGSVYGEEQDGNWLSTNGNNFSHCYASGAFEGSWLITVNCQGTLIPATWATIDKTEGSIRGGESETFTISLNSFGLNMGTSYNANLIINTNDENIPHVEIPVILNVSYGKSTDQAGSSEPLPTAYNHTLDGQGSVRVIGTYEAGSICTMTAIANEGYTFVNWTKDGVEVSTSSTYSFTVTEDAAFVANFTGSQSVVTQTSDFSQGYNWWSTYIEQEGIDGLGMLQDGLGDNGVTIRSQASGYNDYYAGYGWFGSLTSINNESSFRVITSAPCSVTMTGNAAVPSEHPITLSQGWTWIGYVPSVTMDINVAMAGVASVSGDKLKSQHGYSDYYEGYGWFGSLNTIEPGMGLMYYSNSSQSISFIYPDNGRGGALKANLTSENNHWVPNTYAYPDNMTVMAVVDLNDEELNSDHYELSVFATNGECRGSVKLMYAEPLNRHVAFLTVSGKDAAELNFRLYDSETGTEYFDAEESLSFVANAIVGDATNLYVVHFRGETSMEEFASNVRVYPNPVNRGEQFSIGMAKAKTQPVHVEIVNALGMVVETVYAPSVQTIIAPNAAGIYTLRIMVEGKETLVRKLVVK